MKYLGFTTICDILFGVFIIVWFITRHVFYLMTCWSVYSDLPRLTPPACFRGTADNLQGPFPVPNGSSYLLEPFRDPAGVVCFNKNITYGFLVYLLTLQVMMFVWSVFIARVVLRVIKGNSAEDIRSDDESEQEKDVTKRKQVKSLNGNSDVEAVKCNGLEGHTDMRNGASSSSINLNGHCG